MAEDLTAPNAVMARLAAIDNDLAVRQNALEAAGMAWFKAKRDREHKRAVAFIGADAKTVAERNAIADRDTALIGQADEALWHALKAVVDVLQTRASIGQSLLKAQGRI